MAESPPPPCRDLDWSPARARELAGQAVDLWTDVLGRLAELPVVPGETQAQVQAALVRAVPEQPVPLDELAAHLREMLVAHNGHIGHPRFLAYICGSGTVPGTVADLLASGLAQNAGGWQFSPAAHEIERAVLRWLAAELGLPDTAGGVFVTGGSIGNLVGLKLARDRLGGSEVRANGLRGRELAVYGSSEAHDTIARAADILGLGSAALRPVPVDAELRLRADALEERLTADLAAGVRPIALVGTAGTTGTGAIDPLPAIADLAERHGLWFHVDAAYGGPAVLADDLRPLLRGIERADSVTLDAHKWLYTSASSGCLLVRDQRHLVESFTVDPSYVYEDLARTGKGMNSAFFAPTFSRPFDALKVWVSLLAHGRSAYARRISHDAALARYLDARARAHPDFEPVSVSLSICCFRYRPRDLPTGDEADAYADELNRRLLVELQLDGRVFPSNASVHGRFALRACIVNVRTEAPDLDLLLDVAAELGARLDAEARPSGLRAR